MKKPAIILFLLLISLYQCNEKPVYPDTPMIDYENFFLYISVNSLEQEVLTGQVNFSFTDGDGNVGLYTIDSVLPSTPDSLRYNLFMQLYDLQGYDTVEIPEDDGGLLKYTIPYMDKQPLAGTISVTIEYPILTFDTILYTFYIYDRDLNKSNIDTTEFRILSGILD